jgi:hypothetical protein
MATAIKNLTRMGTDVRKIAALLKAKAPEGHMLAYISPEEAQVLKDRGGSGKPHADTGIPSFEEVADTSGENNLGFDQPVQTQTKSDSGSGLTAGPGTDTQTSQDFISANPDLYPTYAGTQDIGTSTTFTPSGQSFAGTVGGYGQEGQDYTFAPGGTPAQAAPAANAVALQELGGAALADQAQAKPPEAPKGMSEQTLKQLGVAGLGALLGASQARKAQAGGQAGAQQLQALATPYQVQGQQLQAQAQAGQLTPAGQQSLQALQAQVAQGAAARGGVGVQQGAAAVEALRQQLLAGQYQLGLQISGIGDKIATGAIQAGMQADATANQLTSSYFNNIARIAAGIPFGTTTAPQQ